MGVAKLSSERARCSKEPAWISSSSRRKHAGAAAVRNSDRKLAMAVVRRRDLQVGGRTQHVLDTPVT